MKTRAFPAVGLLCLSLTGCVQCEEVYTLNPDGSGKVAIVLRTPFNPMDQLFGGPGGPGGKKPTLAEKKRGFLDKLLRTSRGVDAWKAVAAEYTPQGLLEFRGTAYFKEMKGFDIESGANSPVRLKTQPDGSLRLVFAPESLRSKLKKEKGPEGQPDPRKLNEKELDEYILEKRIEYQTMKGILTAMLTDLKFKYVFRLPGDVSEVKGFRPEGKRAVSLELDGNKLLKAINGLMARDNAFFRDQLRKTGSMDIFGDSEQSLRLLGLDWHEATATVARPSGPQFDYAKESAAARDAYPALRKRLGLGADNQAPGPAELK